MSKRANGQSSDEGPSTNNIDGRPKQRRIAAASGSAATNYTPTTSSSRAVLQPTRYMTRAVLTLSTPVTQSTSSHSTAAPQSGSSATIVPSVLTNRPFPVPVQTDYTQPWRSIPFKCDIFIVGSNPPSNMPRNTKYIPDFKARLPYLESKEALKGQKNGTLEMKFEAAGIPTMKYKSEQASEVGEQNKWSVQAIFKIKNSNGWNVHFEGWSSMSMVSYSNDEVDLPYIEQFNLRKTFLEAYGKLAGSTSTQQIENQLYLCDSFTEEDNVTKGDEFPNGEKHLFWSYQDLTFFHSNQEKQNPHSQASIHYFCLAEKMKPPPSYMYTALPIVEDHVIQYCRAKPSNNTFQQLQNLGLGVIPNSVQRICENAENCKCDARYAMLYAKEADDLNNVQFLQDGRIDIDSFSIDKNRVIIECSDECGCSITCPRRPLQRGQQKSVAVFYEGGHKGFGLRAMEKIHKGEFIMEYVGLVFDPDTKTDDFMDTKSATYEASCEIMDPVRLVIDSEHVGNASRFINHKCAPNATFIDTESRRNEKDLLIPRISVYALETIEVGESIFLRYWSKVNKEEGGIKCDCGTNVCLDILPIRKT